MKPTARIRSFLALAGSSLLAISYSHAATLHWDGDIINGGNPAANANGGLGNWNNALTNWDTLAAGGANSAWSAGSTAVFSGSGLGFTVTLTDNITVGGLTFNKVNGGTNYYTINAAANTLSFSSGDNHIRLNIGNGGAPTATITGEVDGGIGANVIVGAQNTVASGGSGAVGTVIFNGISTGGWNGATTISLGTTLTTVSTVAATNKVLNDTSGITLNGGTIQFTRDGNTALGAISDTADINVYGGGTFSVTSTNGGVSAIENIDAVTVNSGQMNFVTSNNQNITVLAGLSRGSSTTSAVTFSSSNFTNNAFSVSGASATAGGEIIGTWATTGTTAALQTDYAVYDGSSRFVARAINTATAQSGWSTTHGATSNYTMSALASATISGGTKNINSLRSTNNSVTVTASDPNITLAGHALAAGDAVTFSATTMPTGLTAGTPYYVVSSAANTIQVSATAGGAAITPTGTPATVVASGAIQVSSGNNLGALGILNGSATTLNILQSGGAGSVTLPSATSGNLFVTAGSGAISIAAPIKDNGAGALALDKGGSGLLTLSSTGNDFTGGLVVNAGTVRFSGDQGFTGGVTLNGGSLGDLADGISAAELDSNSVTVNGNASMFITGGENLASAIAISSTGNLRLAAIASTGTVSGVVSGTGVLTNSAPGNGNGTIILSNTANTHTGIVSIVSDNNASFTIAVNSLVDSASPGAGNIQMGGGGTLGGYTFALHSGAIAPLILNNRQVELVGDGPSATYPFKLSNNSNQAFTINSDLLASGTNVKTLTLGGGNLGGLSTFAGTITNGSHTTLNLTKADANNTWALTNTANSYNGITTITAGTLQVTSLANGGSNSSIGSSSNAAGNLLLNGGTLRHTGGIASTDRTLSLAASSTIDASGSGALTFSNTGALNPDVTGLTGTFTAASGVVTGLASTADMRVGMTVTSAAYVGTKTISSINSSSSITLNNGTGVAAGSFSVAGGTPTARTLTLTGTNNDANTIAGVLQDSTATGTTGVLSIAKAGAGTWVLTNTNAYAGATSVNGGILQLKSGGSNLTQTLGALAFAGGDGTLESNKSGAGNITTTFNAFTTRLAGNTGNIVSTGGTNGTDNTVNITGAAGFIDKGVFFGGSEFAARNATDGYVRALNYATSGGDTNTVDANTITADRHVKLTGTPGSQAAIALLSLNLAGSGVSWTTTSSNLTVPGIIKSGGGSESTISGGNLRSASINNIELVIRTDTASDFLTISSNITQTGGSNGLTKSGAGTLTLSGTANTYNGATNVNGGTLALGANNVLSGGAVTIHSATLNAATFTDAVGTLNAAASATINLGTGAALAFAASNGVTWSGTLNITGTFVSGSSLRFGTANTGLTATQLSRISASGFSNFALDVAGYLTATPTGGNTYATWIAGFSVGGQTGINDDFDKDGLGNAVENLMGTSPAAFNQGLTSVSSTGGNLKFRHTLSTTPASDLTGSYEWSVNLSDWNADGATSGGTTVDFGTPAVITPGTPNLVEVTATVTGTPSSKVFARFKATQP